MNLSKLLGVERCRVSYQQEKATLVFKEGLEPDIEKIRAAVSALGFQPGPATVRELTN